MPASAAVPCASGARSPCPIASALDLLGDKWTLLVIRDLLFGGKKRFGDFLKAPEKIPTNILSDRLRRLEEHGLVAKVLYAERPPRYEYLPTEKSADLFPVLRALVEWANHHLPGTFQAPPGALDKIEERLRSAPPNP